MATSVSTPLNDRFGLPKITSQAAAGQVYMGSNYNYQAGAAEMGQNPISVTDRFIPTEDVWGGYMSLPQEQKNTLIEIMNVKAGGRSWNPEELKGLWADGVLASNYAVRYAGERLSPLDALRRFYLYGEQVAGISEERRSGRGGGGGYSGPVTQTRLTDPTTAESLLNTSLKNYLGRAATGREKSEFLKALNRYEAQNPTVTTPMGPGGSVTTGGAQPTVFAEQFAQSQEGAAEYQAATTYLDAFLGSLGNPVG